MKNRESDLIAVDLDVYAIYLHTPTGDLIAVTIDNAERLNRAIERVNHQGKATAHETVECDFLRVVDPRKGYEISGHRRAVSVSELAFQGVNDFARR